MTLSIGFYILLGAVLVLISFSKPKEDRKKRLISFIPKNTTLKGMIILGIIVFLIESVTLLPYFYSIYLMNHQTIRETTPAILIIIGYNLVMVLSSLLLLGVNIIFKEKIATNFY